MVQELGETRNAMAQGCMDYVMKHIDNMRHVKEPFYAVYCARENRLVPNQIKQTIKFYRERPPSILGVLVWYVDNSLGLIEFKPELSAPWDTPQNPDTLSQKSEDQFIRVMERGQEMKVLTS